MIEVEVKVKVASAGEIRKKIKAIAKFSDRIKKVDAYYTLESLGSYPRKSLRVRKLNGNCQEPATKMVGASQVLEHTRLQDFSNLESHQESERRKFLRFATAEKSKCLMYQINFKEKLSYVKGVHAKRETEFSVSDIKGFLLLINNFGFRNWLVKEKISEIYELKRNFHIELNNVKNLGWFLEIEYLAKPKEIEKARAEILKVMEKLGVKEEEIIKKGYTKMLWERAHGRF